jgi:hypothetical protein
VERRKDEDLLGGESPGGGAAPKRRKLGADPARELSGGALPARSESIPGMEVTRDQPFRPQHRLRGPSVAVEHPDPVADHPFGPVDQHLAREMRGEADVVVSEDHVDGETRRENPREELEHHGSKGSRRPDDRMLDVPRDDDPFGRSDMQDVEECVGEPVRSGLRRTRKRMGCPPEPEVDVGDHEPGFGGSRGRHEERRPAGNRMHPSAVHAGERPPRA